jgi:hypothetical protein
LQDLVRQWQGYTVAEQQEIFAFFFMVASEGAWEKLEGRLRAAREGAAA